MSRQSRNQIDFNCSDVLLPTYLHSLGTGLHTFAFIQYAISRPSAHFSQYFSITFWFIFWHCSIEKSFWHSSSCCILVFSFRKDLVLSLDFFRLVTVFNRMLWVFKCSTIYYTFNVLLLKNKNSSTEIMLIKNQNSRWKWCL